VATGLAERFPLLIFPAPSQVVRDGGNGFQPSVHYPDHVRQGRRLGDRFGRLQAAFDARRLALRARAQNDDPDLVLVFETVGSVDDFIPTAQRVPGLEWLAAVDDEIAPDEDFYDTQERGKPLGGKLFLVGSNRAALDEVVRLWGLYRDNPNANLGPGLSAWKGVFAHLKDARFWSPADRLGPELRDALRFRVEHGAPSIRFEIEAWHFAAAARNTAASAEIRELVGQLGGAVLHESLIGDIAYHGFLVDVPAVGVGQLLDGDAPPLLHSDRVMFFRAQGQAVVPVEAAAARSPTRPPPAQRTNGTAVVALLDGLPLANHPMLRGRVEIDDPDGRGDNYPAAERTHGTAMASLIALGDLGMADAPLARPIYARPIMRPAGPNGQRVERTPEDRLLIDLVHEAVRRMFEATAGRPASAPNVRVINLSVGDPHRAFGGELSPWARLLDWLQHKYNVLFVVSAGNREHGELLLETAAGSVSAMPLEQRSRLATQALCRDDMHRRILAPAESVNALTVGACHSDGSTVTPVPGRFVLFAEGGLAPYSGIGPGFRRAVKPDILLPGGRVLYREAVQSPPGQTRVQAIKALQPPGQLVAAPPTAQGAALHTRGTSNAAALGTRWAARAHGVLETLRASYQTLDERYDAVLIKALLAHGALLGDVQSQVLAARPDVKGQAKRRLASRYGGFGVADVERALSCTAQRATLLGVGALKNDKALEFRVPYPPALHATVVRRKLTVTLAWLTPINARHSKYRVARLWVDLPEGPLRGDRAEGDRRQLRQGTIHHEVFEESRAAVVQDGTTLAVRVNCLADAGPIKEPVRFALCVSLEVEEGVTLPIYRQVRERVALRVGVQSGAAG